MVLAQYGKYGIPESQLGLGQVADNKILLLKSQLMAAQEFFGQEQAGAAIEQKPRRFRERDLFRVEMMPTALKEIVSPGEYTMCCHQVVAEHGNWTVPQPFARSYFE